MVMIGSNCFFILLQEAINNLLCEFSEYVRGNSLTVTFSAPAYLSVFASISLSAMRLAEWRMNVLKCVQNEANVISAKCDIDDSSFGCIATDSHDITISSISGRYERACLVI